MRNKLIYSLLLLGGVLLAACTQQREAYSADFVQVTERPRLATGPTPDLAMATSLIISRTNAFRQDGGRQPVTTNQLLTATAQDFADYMARTDRYGHTADGNQPAERAKQHGYEYCIVAENIAYQYDSTGFTSTALGNGFFAGWQQSPHHRENMLEPAVTETGVALAHSENSDYYYAVQLFGRPRSLVNEFSIRNASAATVRYAIQAETFSLPPRYTRTHQRCQPATVRLQWPTAQTSVTLQPDDGAHYTITQDEAGAFQVESE